MNQKSNKNIFWGFLGATWIYAVKKKQVLEKNIIINSNENIQIKFFEQFQELKKNI